MISLLDNQFLVGTNAALTSGMPCNSPNITNYPLKYLAKWLFLGKFFSRASNTVPLQVRSPRPFCPSLTMGLFQWGCCKERLFCAFTQIGEVVNDSSVFLIGVLNIIHYLFSCGVRRGVIGKVLSCDALIATPKWSRVRSLVQAFRLLTERSATYKRLTCSLQHKYQ